MHQSLCPPGSVAPGKRASAAGFTLVELLIGVTLGLFIAGAATAVFLASRHSFRVQDNATQMQEAARAVLEDVTREIRKAGSFGCFRFKDTNNSVLVTATLPTGAGATFPLPPITNDSPAIRGGNVSGLTLPGASGITPVPGTDFISLMYGQPVATMSIGGGNGQITSVGEPYPLNRAITVSPGQPMAISDCSTATIFRASNLGSTTLINHAPGDGNNALPLDIKGTDPMLSGNIYRAGAIVQWLEMPTFFVAQDGSGLRSLYRWDTTNGAGIQPMIPHVEDMRVVFGVDSSSASGHLQVADAWMNGGAVAAGNLWRNVISASVHLVLRSEDTAGAGPPPRNFAWSAANNAFVEAGTASDQYIRQVVVVNAALRTRAPIL